MIDYSISNKRQKGDDTVESVKAKIQQWVGKAIGVLLDTHTPDARGGTGEAFDWTIATGYVIKQRITNNNY